MWQAPYRPLDERELIAQASGCIALMGGGPTTIDGRVMDALPDLRYVSKCGIGYDSIDVEAATARGILVTNTPVHSEVEIVAEHTIALILAVRKQLTFWTPARLQAGAGVTRAAGRRRFEAVPSGSSAWGGLVGRWRADSRTGTSRSWPPISPTFRLNRAFNSSTWMPCSRHPTS